MLIRGDLIRGDLIASRLSVGPRTANVFDLTLRSSTLLDSQHITGDSRATCHMEKRSGQSVSNQPTHRPIQSHIGTLHGFGPIHIPIIFINDLVSSMKSYFIGFTDCLLSLQYNSLLLCPGI